MQVGTPWKMASLADHKDTWRGELLRGISSVPTIGVPGRLACFEDCAEPILLDDSGQPVMAAARIGKGAIIVFSHDGYTEKFKQNDEDFCQLFDNCLAWLNVERKTVIYDDDVTEASQLPTSSALVVDGGGNGLEKLLPDVVTFLNNGGRLIGGICPWGWLQLNPSKCLDDMPLQNIIMEAGLSFTDDYCVTRDCMFSVATSEENIRTAHFGHTLKTVDNSSFEEFAATTQHCLASLPEKCIEKYFLKNLERCLPGYLPCLGEEIKNKTLKRCQRGTVAVASMFLERSSSKAPGIEEFPGDFESEPQLQCATVTINSKRQERHATGYYLPAGKCLLVKSCNTGSGTISGWKIRVGAHTDKLSVQHKLRRWPNISVVKKLDHETQLFSPYGGNIYLESPQEPSLLCITLENVVEAPCFDLTEPETVNNWQMSCQSPGLWAELAGRHIIFTLPSTCLRDGFNPTEMLVFWDKVVQAHHDLRGTDPSDFARERVVADRQPCAGYMHAGYPIVTHLDIADKDSDASVLNMSLLKTKGNWGLFHELGHNMQRGAWTFEGTTEVTCNIFTLHAMHTLVGIDPWRHPWLRNQWKDIHQYLKKPCYNAWKENPGVGLGVYAQLAHHFGWEPYRKVFREYERDVHPPSDNQDKIDRWIVRFSRTVRRNLVPLFEFWGLSAGETAKADVSEFPSFLPKDEITTMHQSVQ
ncbi:TRPM8 channel-associated factor 1-like [Branchiostoma lanceolatum]|uniref:TRPM8 channel-associated factor 1-like n=1 Tax=Branchiostoma lanceolatum TaxID=7740 RepID=UPI003452B5DC